MFKSISVFSRPSAPSFTRSFCKKMEAAPSPIIRKFVPLEASDSSKHDGFKFRLVSHNILAQVYVKSSYFPHSPAPCLRWKARSQAIFTVLKNLRADFFCLQEVDEYDDFYMAKLKSLGYSSIYIKRTGKKRDGCGIFYKDNCVELILEEKIDYNDLVDSINDDSGSSDDKNGLVPTRDEDGALKEASRGKQDNGRGDLNDPRVRLKRDCVGIMAAFRLKDPSQIVIVANTHIYWDPEWIDVKLAQVQYLLTRLAQFKSRVSQNFNCSPPLIVAGDFNSIPGDKVYEYLISTGKTTEISKETPIRLCSVYGSTKGEPLFTNCTPDFTNTLDYILFSSSGCIRPVSLLELPESDSADVKGCLPNYYHPSDHLPIGAEFEVGDF